MKFIFIANGISKNDISEMKYSLGKLEFYLKNKKYFIEENSENFLQNYAVTKGNDLEIIEKVFIINN